MVEVVGGAVIGALFREVHRLIVEGIHRNRGFGVELSRLNTTLESLTPLVDEAAECLERQTSGGNTTDQTDRYASSRQDRMRLFLKKLQEAKKLVIECSQVQAWEVLKRSSCCRRLLEVDDDLRRWMQIAGTQMWVETIKTQQMTRELLQIHRQTRDLVVEFVKGPHTSERVMNVPPDWEDTGQQVAWTETWIKISKSRRLGEELSRKTEGLVKRVQTSEIVVNAPQARQDVQEVVSEAGAYMKFSWEKKNEENTNRVIELGESIPQHANTTVERLPFLAANFQKYDELHNPSYSAAKGSRIRWLQRPMRWLQRKGKRPVGLSATGVGDQHPEPEPGLITEYSFHLLQKATMNFNRANRIGVGGSACIYRATLRGEKVAIKHFLPGSREEFERAFQVEVLRQVVHPNIVRLLGVCNGCTTRENEEARCLVLEWIPNGNLLEHLHPKSRRPPLSWQARLRIAAEVCNALRCLQEMKPWSVFHGDIKPENILLDDNLTAKLCDFGISQIAQRVEYKIGDVAYLKEKGTALRGTQHYVDPYYIKSGTYTSKSDLYGLGVVLLQLFTGEAYSEWAGKTTRCSEEHGMKSDLVMLYHSTGRDLSALADRRIEDDVDCARLVGLVLADLRRRCCERDQLLRPDLGTVWQELQNAIVRLDELSRRSDGQRQNLNESRRR